MVDAKDFSFSGNSDVQKTLLDWWQGLDQARGDRAELRRATTPTEVAFSPTFHRLLHSLQRWAHLSPASLAVVAGVLAHVKKHDRTAAFAAQLATAKSGSTRPRVSDLRFRRLLKFTERDELFEPLIRTVHLLDGSLNIVSLADGIYFWGDNVRKQWAYSYYEKASSEN